MAGHAIWLLGVAWQFLDIGGRLDMLWRIVEGMGGKPAIIAAVILWPWTGVALIVIGIGYVIFIGEPEKGVQRHHWWPYVGWGIFALSFVAMSGIGLYGAGELYIRREIAKGIAGVPRNTPDENNLRKPQKPLSVANRDLQPDQIRILLREIPKLKPAPNGIMFSIVPGDVVADGIFRRYQDIFARSGISVGQFSQTPRGPEEEGMMLAVEDPAHIPASAEKLREAFEVASIHLKLIELPKTVSALAFGNGKDYEFLVFIGPAPIF